MADEDTCILIVDDEMLNRELLRRVLHREHRVTEAADATEALAILQEKSANVGLILCDQQMPGGISGTELAAKVRENWPWIEFMLLTGYDDDPIVVEALERGLVGEVIAKPWRGAVLKKRISERLKK